ncbi:MAG: apolipoprotein N-acyltransferase [Elusimicrobiota bacterium]
MLRKIKIILYILSGVLLTLSFPRSNMFIFAWIALVPMLIALWNESDIKHAVSGALITGITAYLGIMYWIVPMCLVAGIHIIPGVLFLFALSLYMALYVIIWGSIAFLLRNKAKNIFIGLLLAGSWAGLEVIRNYMITGFPWALLGYSQWNNLYMIQIAEYGGVYGISFMLVLFNYLLAGFINRENGRVRKYAAGMLIIFLLTVSFGFIAMRREIPKDNKIKFSIIQGNVDQYKKFDNDFKLFIMQRYKDLVLREESRNSDIILWPETSFPSVYPDSLYMSRWLSGVVIESGTKNIIGTLIKENNAYYNGAVYFNSDGKEIGKYAKMHLVPFGEVFPFRNILGKIFPVVYNLGGVTRGKKTSLFKINNALIGIGVCFEILFPDEVRNQVKNGANILCNISNDAWYLDTSAPWQHLSYSVFRAIENRRMVVRSANTGVSAVIDEKGRIIKSLGLFKTGVLTADVYAMSGLTFYTQYGYIFIVIFLLTLIITLIKIKYDCYPRV